MPGKIKTFDLRTKDRKDLLKQLEELKSELAQLRVAKVTGGAASKLAKIKVIRKSIARVLTVYNQTQKQKLRDFLKGKKYLPKDLRKKQTRAIRRRLSNDEKYVRVAAPGGGKYKLRRTARAQKKADNFPARRYAVKA